MTGISHLKDLKMKLLMSKKIIALFKTIMKNYLYDVISGNNIKH